MTGQGSEFGGAHRFERPIDACELAPGLENTPQRLVSLESNKRNFLFLKFPIPESLTRAEPFCSGLGHETLPPCAGLFSDLGADGTEALTKTLYYPADPYREKVLCRRAPVFTWMGASQTYVCRRFSSLPLDDAAESLIHEALHHVGLTEWPADRKGMHQYEITAMIRLACGF